MPSPAPPVRSAKEWWAHGANGTDPEAFGPLAGWPLVAVRIDGDPALGPLSTLLRRLPCVTLGVGVPGPEGVPPAADLSPDVLGLDVFVTQAADPPAPWVGCPELATVLSALAATVAATPQAAIALVQLLRLSEQLVTADGLVAESSVYSTLQAGAEHRRWLDGRTARRHPASGPSVMIERHGPRLEVELHRPEVRNAFNTDMRDRLTAAFQLAAADPTIGQVAVRGAGPAFCSGGDLDEFGTAPDPATAHLIRTTRSTARALLGCADRTSFFVHGPVVGAGLELAALAGFVSASPEATFSLPEVSMGLVPGAGGTATIPRRIGRHRTAYLALAGRPLDAGTAAAWGLVDEVRPGATAAGEPGQEPPGAILEPRP